MQKDDFMKTISADIIDDTWKRMKDMPINESLNIMEQFGKEQPVLLAYLYNRAGNFNRSEKGLMLYAGTVVWCIMSQGVRPLPKISEQRLEEAERKNNRMLDYIAGEPESEIPRIMKVIMSGYNQHLILEHILAEVMKEPDKDERVIREENSGILLYCLKTVIDCFENKKQKNGKN